MIDALRQRRLPLARGGAAPWTYVEDAATATVAALEHVRGGEGYNICDDEAASWLDVISELARVFDAPEPMAVPGALVRVMAPYAGVLMTRTNMRLSIAKPGTSSAESRPSTAIATDRPHPRNHEPDGLTEWPTANAYGSRW
ncbi:MAG: hypothetical protein J2P18_14345 [Nocardia sp.]|nr:hypothetical protein [Nocardia sp.]